ncbi:hypothetical protein WMF45_12205 [Sorangium sp. So ce448]
METALEGMQAVVYLMTCPRRSMPPRAELGRRSRLLEWWLQ